MNANRMPATEKKRYDWVPILLYLGIVLFGWLNIYAACYDEYHAQVFDFSRQHGKQLLWMGVAFLMAVCVLLIHPRVFSNGSYIIPEMPHVEFCPSDAWGVGDRMMATIPNNLQYGVDSESNQSFVKVQFGSDEDAQDVIFQIQSIQGTRLMNPLPSAFVMNNGSIRENVINGDYTNQKLIVTADDTMGAVKVNGQAYTTPAEFAPNSIITLKAEPKAGYRFVSWSNGKTDAEITITATGMPMAVTAIFAAE